MSLTGYLWSNGAQERVWGGTGLHVMTAFPSNQQRCLRYLGSVPKAGDAPANVYYPFRHLRYQGRGTTFKPQMKGKVVLELFWPKSCFHCWC